MSPDTASDIASHTFNILCLALIAPIMHYRGSDESLHLSPRPFPQKTPPYVRDNSQMLIRTLKYNMKRQWALCNIQVLEMNMLFDWQWYMQVVCVFEYIKWMSLSVDCEFSIYLPLLPWFRLWWENSRWITLPACAPYSPSASLWCCSIEPLINHQIWVYSVWRGLICLSLNITMSKTSEQSAARWNMGVFFSRCYRCIEKCLVFSAACVHSKVNMSVAFNYLPASFDSTYLV